MAKGDNTVIVASLGRAGSTALYNSVYQSVGYSQVCFYNRLPTYDYPKRTVYKTHDFPPDYKLPDHVKFIWTFADPCEIVLSLINQEEEKGIEWVENHFEHMRGEFDKYRNIYTYDALHLEEHFEKWYGKQGFDLLTVKYRSIWDKEKELSQYVGTDVKLPTFSPRQRRFDKLDSNKKEMMLDTYGGLREQIKKAEDFKIW